MIETDSISAIGPNFRQKQWPGNRLPSLYYDPRSLETNNALRASLHAKCIVVDQEQAFVSSANFTEAAQTKNIEVGVIVRSAAFACKLAEHFEALASAGILRPIPIG
jgi:phosphatidylserine/phosphatidylglycerophosphate/cardiolipin synthase-like enzyme